MAPPTRAFERGHLTVSHSQVQTYLICPEQFRQKYVRGAPPSHRSSEAVFGTTVHAVLAQLHEHVRQHRERPPLAPLLDEFDRRFADEERHPVPMMFEDDEAPAKLVEKGRGLIGLYYEQATPHTVLAVEQQFVLPSSALPGGVRFEEQLAGVVDLVEQDADGRVFITELKTSARKFDANRLRFDRQITLYAAAREVLGVPEANLRFRVLLKTKEPRIETHEIRREPEEIARAARTVEQVLRAIDHGIFYPLQGWQCASCPFKATCEEG